MSRTGSSIGGYEVKAELGRGPIGVSHQARDPKSGREVLLTTISMPESDACDERDAILRRLGDEIEAVLAISHPGIVTVHEFGKGTGGEPPFIVTEFVSERTLRDLLDGQYLLDPDWALPAAQNLADALRVARDAGLAVGHLEPSGIRVRESDGVTKIAEHGVLCLGSPRWTDGVASHVVYLAPECLDGRTGDLRSDLFSLAIILYEMMCGERPFRGEDIETIRESLLHDSPAPITGKVKGLSPAFDEFFERALAKEPDARFPDAVSFRHAIHDLRRQQRLFQRHRSDDAEEPLPELEESVPVGTDDLPALEVQPPDLAPSLDDQPAVPLVDIQESDPSTVEAQALDGAPTIALSQDLAPAEPPEPAIDLSLDPPPLAVQQPDPSPSIGEPPAPPPVETGRDEPTAKIDPPAPPPPRSEPRAPRRAGARPSAVRPPVPRTARRGPGRPIVVIAALALLVTVVAVAIWGLRGERAEPADVAPGRSSSGDLAAAPGGDRATPSAADAATTAAKPGIRVHFGEEPVAKPAASPAPNPKRSAEPARPPAPKQAPESRPEVAAVVEPPAPAVEPPAAEEIAAPVAAPVEPARVQLLVKNSLKDGSLTLLVDGATVYAAQLADGSRRMGRLYKKATGKSGQSVATEIEIPAGRHTIVARVANHKKGKQHEKSLDVELEPGQMHDLTIVIGRSFGRALSLKLGKPS